MNKVYSNPFDMFCDLIETDMGEFKTELMIFALYQTDKVTKKIGNDLIKKYSNQTELCEYISKVARI